MKKAGKIAGLMLMIILAANMNLIAQRGMRGYWTDSTRTGKDSTRIRPVMQERRMPGNGHDFSGGMMMQRRNMPGFGQGFRGGMMMYGKGRVSMHGRPMQQDFRRMPPVAYGNMNRPNSGQGRRLAMNIPGLTEKQKAELEKLNENRREEMQQMMQEQREKIKKIREDNRNRLMNILNDDQKRWLEEHDPADRI